VALSTTACDSKAPTGNWTARPINVNGDLSDWEKVPVTYFEQLETEIAVCNDSSFLYVMFRFENEFRARMIRFGGVTVWVDTMGGKDKVFGVRFNGSPDTDFQPPPDRVPEDEAQAAQREERMQRFMDENPVALTLVQSSDDVAMPILDIDGADGPAAACDYWRHYVVYEFRIPLAQAGEYEIGLDASLQKELAVGLEFGSRRPRRDMDRRQPPDSLRRDTTTRERRGDGRPGRRGPREVWLTTGLAASADK
jgi:hypothetical protein